MPGCLRTLSAATSESNYGSRRTFVVVARPWALDDGFNGGSQQQIHHQQCQQVEGHCWRDARLAAEKEEQCNEDKPWHAVARVLQPTHGKTSLIVIGG